MIAVLFWWKLCALLFRNKVTELGLTALEFSGLIMRRDPVSNLGSLM
jgi:hypothetical protein